jgi:hypothetical protein
MHGLLLSLSGWTPATVIGSVRTTPSDSAKRHAGGKGRARESHVGETFPAVTGSTCALTTKFGISPKSRVNGTTLNALSKHVASERALRSRCEILSVRERERRRRYSI